MTASQIKILVSVFFVLALWRIFEIPGVATAFWAFCTVGAIPGSQRELGMETMLRILCILFAVVFFLIFRKEFFAAWPRRHREQGSTAVVIPEPIQAPAAQPATAQPIIISLQKQRQLPMARLYRPLVVGVCVAAIGVIRAVLWIELKIGTFLTWLKPRVRIVGESIRHAAKDIWQSIHRFLYISGRFTVRTMRLIWRVVEPRIRTFDSWIEQQLRANKYTGETLRAVGDVSKAANGVYRKARATTRELLKDDRSEA